MDAPPAPAPVQRRPGRPRRLIFVNRYFHPDHSATAQMLADLAFALAEDGRPVHVVTSRLRYDAPAERLPARETIRGVEVHRVATTGFGRARLVGRAVDYGSFYLAAARALWRLAGEGDIVVAMTDPPIVSAATAPVVRLRRARQVNWLQDVFPEVALGLGAGRDPMSRLALGAARSLRDRSMRRAHANVVLGERMAEHVRGLGIADVRVRQIGNWADGSRLQPVPHAANPLRAAWGLEDAFVVAYSGNLGRAHEYETLLGAIAEADALQKQAASEPRIAWLLIGGGALYETLRRETLRRGLAAVRFEPYQPREQLSLSLSVADVHLVSLRPELEGLVMPSKIYGIAAVGRQAVFIGDADGEVARLLAAHECGVTVAEGDSAALARTVLALAADPGLCRLRGENARRAFETAFDMPQAVERWRSLLAEIDAAG